MGHRVEIKSKIHDGRSETLLADLKSLGFKISNVKIINVYTIAKDFSQNELKKITDLLLNSVNEEIKIDEPTSIENFDFAIEIGFLPGVTDNIATTIKEEISESINCDFKNEESVYSSFLYLISGEIDKQKEISESLYNPLIQRAQLLSKNDYIKNNGMGISTPLVKLELGQTTDLVSLDLSDEELTKLGKEGVLNKDGSRRGPLALDLESLKEIKKYFNKEKRIPTDIEIESLAQTWSEHCKHTIFAASLDEIKGGLYKDYIKKATQEIRKKKGKNDICVSVFVDNSGGIIFDDEYLITDKVETHNSPSALDPFGGAITGIVGVNRDTIGFGMGAKPVINRYGFCFADPRDERKLYKGSNKTQKMLSPRKIMEGVISGVNVGGNCSGIPSPQGFIYFDEKYRGKPLVFVGTVGLIPRTINRKDSTKKQAQSGDYIVMIGGKVGADGIHGATFSSEAMDSGSPATAVQIGDPITQKKLSDAIVKEARDLDLYTSITDNGAGGISCSVAEMAKECGGCVVDLEKVPLKYPGLKPWEIWISESQERMTLSVPKEKWNSFDILMKKRGVEATIIGEFKNNGKCIVKFNNNVIMDISMDFLHDGLPDKVLTSSYQKKINPEPDKFPTDLDKIICDILSTLNISSFEFISTQYDHEVQGGSVLKPLQGKGRVNSTTTITRPRLDSKKGVVLSQALYPNLSEIDTYHMAACTIDTAIRNAISAGGDINKLALLDNFCWCSSNEPERLGQLKEAVKACYDYSVAFETPFISGKDSMFNDFVGYEDDSDNKIKISVPPTLLISSIGVIDDVSETIDIAFKTPGDLIYVIGETKDELGGSEYYKLLGAIGNTSPKVDAKVAKERYQKVTIAIKRGLLASSISIERGGIGVALAKSTISSNLGVKIDINTDEKTIKKDQYLFSETQSRFLVSIAKENKEEFEKLFSVDATFIGEVSDNNRFIINSNGEKIINLLINDLQNNYHKTLKDY